MSGWRRFWGRHWELSQDPETREGSRGAEIDRDRRLPPVAARGRSAPGVLRGLLGVPGLTRHGTGRSLPSEVRDRLEPGLGVDLSAVRVHEDEAVAWALDAEAVTAGDQIVVDPTAGANDAALLTHEAVHAAQGFRRGVSSEIGNRGTTSEREAQIAEALPGSRLPESIVAGPPVPELQRRDPTTAHTPASPLVRREAVRVMLLVRYGEQGGHGNVVLTPALQRELRRLVPALDASAIARLWTPEPAGPGAAFQRLVDAGYLPLFSVPIGLEPEPEPEGESGPRLEPTLKPEQVLQPKDEPELPPSPAATDVVGLHLRLHPRVPPPIADAIRRQLAGRGIPLGQRQLDALIAGRPTGITQLERVLGGVAAGLTPEQRRNLAETVADALLDAGLHGQLENESPAAVERVNRQFDALVGAQGPLPGLLQRIPVGVSVTVYF